MLLLHHFPPVAGWDIEIRATDLSTRALERARAAVWPLDRAGDVPDIYLRGFMLRGTGPQAGMMKAGPKIRSIVRFERLNLHDATYPGLGIFDLIFCRNVLMYFSSEAKTHVVANLLQHLVPDGYLFVGHAETLAGLNEGLRAVMPTVYAPVAT
jgi:chemotaxis protein methyltransferase CheR